MEVGRGSGEAHGPEGSGGVDLADGGFEVVDGCVHDVGSGVMIGLERPVWANRAASLLALLEEKSNWSLWTSFWPAVRCNWFVPGV